MSDTEIVAAIQRGDERALEVLYRRHYRMMVKMIQRNSGTEDEAKDVYQDALIVFWEKVTAGRLVLTSRISTYLYSVCQNLWRKELERKGRWVHEEHDLAEEYDQDRPERIRIVQACLERLGETCRKILMYYYFDRLPMADIATRLGFANADTAKTKKYKCKQELDRQIKSLYTASDFMD